MRLGWARRNGSRLMNFPTIEAFEPSMTSGARMHAPPGAWPGRGSIGRMRTPIPIQLAKCGIELWADTCWVATATPHYEWSLPFPRKLGEAFPYPIQSQICASR